jgi:type I restriction enzyme S subunit
MNKGKAVTPKLRFPEFRDAAGWKTTILGELSEVVRGGSPRPIDGFLTTAADGLNWLKIGDVDKEAKFVTQTAEKVRPEALSKTRVVNPGDLILSNSMSFGRPYILQIKTCIHDGWIAITSIANGAERDFLYYLISAPSSQSYFVDNAAGSGVQNLNADIIKALPVCFPPPPEQQKIAECLSAVDELMAAQARKLDALKTHKKGLMQQLFPTDGETQPRLRFPEFQNAGEWEEVPLSELVGSLDAGVSVNSGDRPATDNEIGVLKTSAVTNGIFEAQENKVVFDEVEIGRVKEPVQGDTIIISRMNTPALVGANAYVETSLENIFLPDRLWAAKSKPGTSMRFVASILGSDKGRAALSKLAKGSSGSMKNITKPDVLAFLVMAPSPAEQQLITDCLTSLDDLIAAQTQKLDALKTHKKGLMQQLFPSAQAVEA